MSNLEELMQVVHKHMPASSKPRPGLASKCEFYSMRILGSKRDASLEFGASMDSENIQSIHKQMKRLIADIMDLAPASKTQLNARMNLFNPQDDELGSLTDILVNLGLAEKAIEDLRKMQAYNSKPSSKPNWQAMAIAKCCRQIWAENEWESDTDKYGPPPMNSWLAIGLPSVEKCLWQEHQATYETFLEKHAPISQHHDRPGPFGRFLEDVFECLGIFGRDGGPVTAATALDALGRQEKTQIK